MKTIIKTGLAAILLLAVSCKKENSTIHSSRLTDESSTSNIITFKNDPGKYTAVKIGNQIWLQQNLAVSHYRNGDKIPQVKDAAKWNTLTTGAWCWYNNDSATGAIYGKLYNWYAVNDPRGLAPRGWHVSSNAEWDTLAVFLANHVGGKLKDTGTIEAGTGVWHAPNFGATNESGFTGLPGGYRTSIDGGFYAIGYVAYWWTTTGNDTTNAWYRTLFHTSRKLGSDYVRKSIGLSVRCIKD